VPRMAISSGVPGKSSLSRRAAIIFISICRVTLWLRNPDGDGKQSGCVQKGTSRWR
jgi:hypothetical protein